MKYSRLRWQDKFADLAQRVTGDDVQLIKDAANDMESLFGMVRELAAENRELSAKVWGGDQQPSSE